MTTPSLPAPLSRLLHGRVLGGVCAGVAARWGLPVRQVRAAFAVAAALLGLGLAVYAAGWLILPAEGEDGGAPGPRGIVLLAGAAGALVALAVLAIGGAVATVFGFGWVVVALAGAVLAGGLLGWPRVGPAWALLPVAALALPSVAVAAGGLRIDPQSATVRLAPASTVALPVHLHSGLGLLAVDLRRTAWPARGTTDLEIDAGLRRTLIALPHDRCVHVEVRQHALPPATRLAAAALGAGFASAPGVRLFADPIDAEGVFTSHGRRPGPTLRIDFSSAGGGLVVRDYPDRVDPSADPDWPGYAVSPEVRPETRGTPREEARRMLRAWRKRRAVQVRDEHRIERLMAGPCAAPPRATAARRGAAAHRRQAARSGRHGR